MTYYQCSSNNSDISQLAKTTNISPEMWIFLTPLKVVFGRNFVYIRQLCVYIYNRHFFSFIETTK